MSRETSVEAYYEQVVDKIAPTVREEVFTSLAERGRSTANELYYYMKDKNPKLTHHISMSSRIGELRAMGVVEEMGKHECKITGRNALLFEAKKKAIAKPFKKRHKRKVVDSVLKDLRVLWAVVPESNEEARTLMADIAGKLNTI